MGEVSVWSHTAIGLVRLRQPRSYQFPLAPRAKEHFLSAAVKATQGRQ